MTDYYYLSRINCKPFVCLAMEGENSGTEPERVPFVPISRLAHGQSRYGSAEGLPRAEPSRTRARQPPVCPGFSFSKRGFSGITSLNRDRNGHWRWIGDGG